MVSGNNTVRSNLGLGYEQFNVHTGQSRAVSSPSTTVTEGGVNALHTGESFSPSKPLDEADAAEQMLLRWNSADTTRDTLGSSAQIAAEVGFKAPAASSQADPGNIGYLAGGALSFGDGDIGSGLLNGNSGGPKAERTQASHDGWLLS